MRLHAGLHGRQARRHVVNAQGLRMCVLPARMRAGRHHASIHRGDGARMAARQLQLLQARYVCPVCVHCMQLSVAACCACPLETRRGSQAHLELVHENIVREFAQSRPYLTQVVVAEWVACSTQQCAQLPRSASVRPGFACADRALTRLCVCDPLADHVGV